MSNLAVAKMKIVRFIQTQDTEVRKQDTKTFLGLVKCSENISPWFCCGPGCFITHVNTGRGL